MKIFLSWSGERSQSLAQELREWLPMVLHYVEPWLSKSDIGAGDRWALEIAKELEATKFGVICITRENIASSWILFEAGALTKSMQEGHVVPLLLDIEFKDIAGPLSQFQAKKVDKAGVYDLVKSINRIADPKLTDARLDKQFEALWAELEAKVIDIASSEATEKHDRPQTEVLEELVTSVRGLDIRLHRPDWAHKYRHKIVTELLSDFLLDTTDPVRFLLIGSLFRDDLPWIYELGVDAYRAATTSDFGEDTAEASYQRFFLAVAAIRSMPDVMNRYDSILETVDNLKSAFVRTVAESKPVDSGKRRDDLDD